MLSPVNTVAKSRSGCSEEVHFVSSSLSPILGRSSHEELSVRHKRSQQHVTAIEVPVGGWLLLLL